MVPGHHGPPGQHAVLTVFITNGGPAVTLNLKMEDCTAGAGTRPALAAQEGCADQNCSATLQKMVGQKTVRT